MFVKVPGIDWFIHPHVLTDLDALGRVRPTSRSGGARGDLRRWILDDRDVVVVCDEVPITYHRGSGSYGGGWSQRIDDGTRYYSDYFTSRERVG